MDGPIDSNGKRVHIVDDDSSVRVALSRLLGGAGYQVSTYTSASDFLESVRSEGAGCVVVDLRLPGVDGMELHRRLRDRGATLAVIFLTGFGDIPTSVEAMKSGAFDFLEKPVAPERLLGALSKAFAQNALHHQQIEELQILTRGYESLTPRERQVMQLMVRGRLNKQIARDLGIAEKTVKVHRARVMSKMGAKRLAILVQYANRLGLSGTTGGSTTANALPLSATI